MSVRLWIAIFVVALVVAWGVLRRPNAPAVDSRTIDAWLNCDECIDGERAAVRALGRAAEPALERALRSGPPRDRLDNMKRKLTAVYASLDRSTKTPAPAGAPLTVPLADYVNTALHNYVANYQIRAATTLGDIGGTSAKNALQAALAPASVTRYRRDVVEAIRAAHARLDDPFPGSIVPTSASYGDTVIVRAPAYELFDLNELAELDGSPYPPNEVLLFREASRLGFAVTSAPGTHVLTIHNVGTTTNSEHTTLVVRSFIDANDRQMASCASTDFACQIAHAPRVVSLPKPLPVFLTMWRSANRPDTMDLLRFMPTAPLTVTAQLSWATRANLDLRWIRCATQSPVGNSDGATPTNNPERTSVTIPAGACWALLALITSPDPVNLLAKLQLTSP